ncbi:MAG: heme ABC transporter permease CcmC [Gammaproteobacteria bacterium]
MTASARDSSSPRGSLLRFSAPAGFYPLAGMLAPWFAGAAAVLAVAGLWIAFLVAPADYRQDEVYRIVFLHVPAAWMSMFIYIVMGFWAAVGLVMRTRLSHMMMRALAPTGTLFCFLALWSGALWGKPTWGTYWVWDARLTSQLLLLFLYLGFLALTHAIEDQRRADRAGAMIALVGVVNVPIIYFSVYWWNTLHQGASITPTGGASMPDSMLAGILIMTLAAWSYSIAAAFWRLRDHILRRERHAEWVFAEINETDRRT